MTLEMLPFILFAQNVNIKDKKVILKNVFFIAS